MVARDEEYSPSLSRPSSARREDQNLGLSEPGNAATCQPIQAQAESPYSFVQLEFQVQISLIQRRKASLRCLASVSQPHEESADEWIVKRERDDEQNAGDYPKHLCEAAYLQISHKCLLFAHHILF